MPDMAPGDPQLRHVDRAWASAMHAFQDRTVDTVIAAMEANHPTLTTHKTFIFVEISRARDRTGCLPPQEACKATLDNSAAAGHPALVIGSIRHKALRNYWTGGRAGGLNGEWVRKLRRILSALEAAEMPEGMNYPGSYFHALKGGRAGRYSVRLTANYRVTFGWIEDRAVDVDIEDYHR